MYAILVERARSWRRRRTLTQVLHEHQRLPVPTTIEELARWLEFMERWDHTFSFRRYSASRGETILCQTRYNVVTELFDALRTFTDSMRRAQSVALPEITFRLSREHNLDYFLTDQEARPLEIHAVLRTLLAYLNELVRIGSVVKFDPSRTSADFQYYENKGAPLFSDATDVLSVLIYASDLNLD